MGETKWLKTIINNQLKENLIKEILSVQFENAVPAGDNYLSDIQQVTMEVLYENGFKAKQSIIFKKAFTDEKKAKLIEEHPLFKTEIFAYENVLNGFEQLMNEYQDYNKKLWCKLIGCKGDELIILQDLKAKHYRPPVRKELLNLNHAYLLMHSLGRFHGLGHVLLHKNRIDTSKIGHHFFENDSKMNENIIAGGLQLFSDVIKNDWAPEWIETGIRLGKQENIAMKKVLEIMKSNPNLFKTISHGDCWTCNLMFKYCPYKEDLPVTMKFLDFSDININSYIYDVLTFLYSSVKPEVRRNNFENLLKFYHKSLVETLSLYDLKENAPSIEEIYAEVKRTEYVTFITCITTIPIVCSDLEKPLIMENLNYDYREKNPYDGRVFNGDVVKYGISVDLKNWMDIGVF